MKMDKLQDMINTIKTENPKMVFAVSWNINKETDVIENINMSLYDKNEVGHCGTN